MIQLTNEWWSIKWLAMNEWMNEWVEQWELMKRSKDTWAGVVSLCGVPRLPSGVAMIKVARVQAVSLIIISQLLLLVV